MIQSCNHRWSARFISSKDEYMIDAPTVAMIGNGSSDAGAKKLDNMRKKFVKQLLDLQCSQNK